MAISAPNAVSRRPLKSVHVESVPRAQRECVWCQRDRNSFVFSMEQMVNRVHLGADQLRDVRR